MTTWKIWYVSCEGNERWYTWEYPDDWEEWEVRQSIQIGSCGDDIAEIISLQREPPSLKNYEED